MLSGFEKKIADFIKANGLFGSDDGILLAVSGGADSTALIYAVCAIRAERILSNEILCAHINHQLRGSDSDGDEAFVIEEANKLNLPITTRRLDVRGFARENKLSIETAARKLRIESLLDIAKAENCSCIATAHQKDDNAETILQRLIRGTGFRGLGGIWPRRRFADSISFVRPLLCVRRGEIVEYLRKRNLKWRQDHTNVDCAYRRNFIRHRLIPVLQRQCRDCLAEQLSELAQSARGFFNSVRSEAEKVWPEVVEADGEKVTLNLKNFLERPQPVKIELIRGSLLYLGSGERDLTEQHYERLLELTEQNVSGREIGLPGGFVVRREYDKLIFGRIQKAVKRDKQVGRSIDVQIPGQTQFGSFSIEATVLETDEKQFEKFKQEKTNFVERFDLDKVKLPLAVRFRKDGDRFVPLGLRKEKKVGKFLTTAKVPQQVREKALMVSDSEKIIWVWPIRISEQAKVTAGTRKILQLRINDAESLG